MSNEPRDTVRNYLRAFNDRNHDAIEEYVSEDAIQHGVHAELHGHDQISDYLDRHFTAFPDYTGETEEIVVGDEIVAIRYRAQGTHTGEYKDVDPTGLTAEWTGMAMYRVKNGKINEIWLEEDRLGLLEQLEMVDKSEPAHLRL